MNEYIKKSVLLEAIAAQQPSAEDYDIENPDNKSLQDIAYWAARDMFDDIVSIVEGSTPTECKPVVRGYWQKVEPILTRYTYICSVCETEIGYDKYGNLNFSGFCPECGAKMGESEV